MSIGRSKLPSLCNEGKSSEEKIIKKTDGSTGSNHCDGGVGTGNKSYSEESFENYDANDNDSFANDDKPVDSYNNPAVNNGNIPASVVINSSSKLAQSEDRSNETQEGRDTSSKAKKGRFLQLVLHSLNSHSNLPKNHHLFYMIVMNSPSKSSYLYPDKEQHDKELEMCRLELNTQCKENSTQRQMMQMMMETLLTYNNQNVNIGQVI